jgi:hypothetical protein
MFLKILNKEENHHGLQYRTGLIEDTVSFDDGGGLHFTTPENGAWTDN